MSDFRAIPSVVGAVKEAYRGASKCHRQQLRAWMRRVLAGEDGNDEAPADLPPLTLTCGYAWDEKNLSHRVAITPSREPTDAEREAIERASKDLQKQLLGWPTTWTEVPR